MTKQRHQRDPTPLPTSSSSSKRRSNCKKKKKQQQQQFPHKAQNSQGSLRKTQNRNFMDLDEYMMYLDANHHALYSIHFMALDEYQMYLDDNHHAFYSIHLMALDECMYLD
jgi:hypothetical protein